MIQLPKHPLPAKPRFMDACNGCGLCCALELCGIGELAFPGAKPPCPALKIRDDRTICEFVETEIANGLPPIVQRTLGIGYGCSMEDSDPIPKTP